MMTYPDDPYVDLAVAVIAAGVKGYASGPVDSRPAELAFLLDVKTPFHQLLDLDEETVHYLINRLQKEHLCRNGYRRTKSPEGRRRLSESHLPPRSSSAPTSGSTSSSPSGDTMGGGEPCPSA